MSWLTPEETRVLGVLMEKAVTTPDQYPLTLNSLTLGCNQKTSRDPVMELDEDVVEAALEELRDRRLAWRVDLAGSRVPKYRHRIDEAWELSTPEHAILCTLLLRGPQTAGQLRQRSERIYCFRDLDHVREVLDAMMDRAAEPKVLTRLLPMRAGSKEQRFAHTLSEFLEESAATASDEASASAAPLPASPRDQALAEMREEISALRAALDELRADHEAFKAQF